MSKISAALESFGRALKLATKSTPAHPDARTSGPVDRAPDMRAVHAQEQIRLMGQMGGMGGGGAGGF